MRKFILMLLPILMLCGCGQKEEKNVDLHQLIHTMETVVDFGNTTEDDLTHQEVASLYGISPDHIKQGYVYYSTDEKNADKIIILEATDSQGMEKSEKALAEYLNSQVNSWSGIESESKKVENHILKTYGNFVMFAICSNPDKVEELFDKYCEPL